MKMSVFLMFAGAFCLMAETAVSQNVHVNLNRANASLVTVLNDIEAQTEYLFIYKSGVNVQEETSVSAEEEPLSAVLDEILTGTGIHYNVQGKHIILSNEQKDRTESAASVPTGQTPPPVGVRRTGRCA